MSRRLVGWILRLAPGHFRERYGEEFERVHGDRARDGNGVGADFAVREVIGAVALVARLRWEERRHRHGSHGDREEMRMFDGLGQDLRYTARALVRNPTFTVAAVATLALGIGANTAIFGAANAYFFRPLPFAEPDRLVTVYETNPEFGWEFETSAPANLLDWRDQVEAFEDVSGYSEFLGRQAYVRDGEPELLGVTNVIGNFFDVLGARAAVGRPLRYEDTWDGREKVAVLSHGLWTSHFGSDPAVVGRTLELRGETRRVVGVMDEGFTFPDRATQLWVPFEWESGYRDAAWFRRAHWIRPVARLKPGVTAEEADAQLQVVMGRLSRDFPATNSVMGAGSMPFRAFQIREVRRPLLILAGAVALLLVLACVNVANLILVRSSDRERELALRYALGAGRRRVNRLMVVESLTLSTVGGGVGLALGWFGVRVMQRFDPLGIEGATDVALDHRVVAFALGLSAMCGLVFAAVSAGRAATAAAGGQVLRDGARGTGSRRRFRLVNGLVTVEVALALMLVAGAGLMIRSALALRSVDPGFESEGRLAVQFTLPENRYPDRASVAGFYDGFLAALEARQGIRRAGTVAQLPLSGTNWTSQFQAEGWPPDRVGLDVVHRRADAAYFETVGTPLIRGRLFRPSDDPDGPRRLVVNETFARDHFPGEDPLGQRIAFDRTAAAHPDEANWWEIVGVVADQRQVSPAEPARPEVFEDRRQDWGRDNWVVLRTEGDPTTAIPVVRSVLREMDPLLPIAELRPMEDVWARSMAREDFILRLLTLFGVLALALAAVGVYGVTAQVARARTREIGIRMALGAAAPSVVSLMLRRGLQVVAVGLVLGLAGSLAAGKALESVLFRVAPNDPGTLGTVVVLLGAVATLACYIPARRATAVDPVDSLREE